MNLSPMYNKFNMISYFINVLSPVLCGTDLMRCLYAEIGITHNSNSPPPMIEQDDIASVSIHLNVMRTYLNNQGISSALHNSIISEINRLKDMILVSQSKFDNNDYQQSIEVLTDNFNSFINRIGQMNARSEIMSEYNILKNHIYRFYCELGRMFINMNKNEQAIMNSIKIGDYWVNQIINQSYIDVNCVNMLVIEVINLASILKIEVEYQ